MGKVIFVEWFRQTKKNGPFLGWIKHMCCTTVTQFFCMASSTQKENNIWCTFIYRLLKLKPIRT